MKTLWRKATSIKKRWLLIGMLLVAGVGGAMLPGRVSVTLSDSVKDRVWWLDHNLEQIHHGDYVLFAFPIEMYRGGAFPKSVQVGESLRAIKRVGCDEGETVIRQERDFYCGNEFLGRAKQKARTGEPLEPTSFAGIVPPGQVFLVGDHPDSFDSRYFGLIPKNRFLYRALGLF